MTRVGERVKNNQGEYMEIVEYRKAIDITVKFESGNLVKTRYDHFKSGSVKDLYYPSVFGVGFWGEGIYKSHKNGIKTKEYATWKGIMERCYDKNRLKRRRSQSYKECTVCEEWHNFQNFGKWFDENYVVFGDGTMCLDKDILIKGNKVYSPTTCCFADARVNTLFTNRAGDRGKFLIGVSQKNEKCGYQVYISKNGVREYLKTFDTEIEAFLVYKNAKEKYIKEVADEYKAKYPNFPQKLYDAMYKWEVEITD